jgi:DNA-binding response OmpR family regulator
MHILIIEDDPVIASNLYDYLHGQGHAVDAAADGITGLHLAVSQDWDAIVLDLALPGMTGLDLCRKLREQALQDTPVLIVTARDTLDDKLEGFSQGADDYLVKPFSLQEVEARLLALVRRYQGRTVDILLRVGDLVFDPRTLTVERGGEPVKLSPKCLRLLELMMRSPNKVFSREELETAIWGEVQPDSDSLRTHMYALRRALTERGGNDPIENLHGLGYKLVKANAR